MPSFQPFKRVINGKSYNTETATLIDEKEDEESTHPFGNDQYPHYKQLFRTRYGKFFLVIRNKPFINPASGDLDLQDQIYPIESNDDVVKWMEKNCPEKIEIYFDVPEAGDTSTTLTLRLDKKLKYDLNRIAMEENISLNSFCIKSLDNTEKTWKPGLSIIPIGVPEIPHGHGLSFKRGISDGLLEKNEYEDQVNQTHSASYRRGVIMGNELKEKIAKLVK